jgi:predicted phage terminase large subunit-like protein
LKQSAKKFPATLQQIEAEVCKRSLYEFVLRAWHVVETDVYADGWHVQAVCQYLEACYDGRVRNLIVNVPPRHMKSLLLNVFFPAWVWTKNPSKKFLFTSYSEDLVARDSEKCKKLIQSQWYQERFSVTLEVSPSTTTKFMNTKGGYRYSFGFGGSITGQGGDFVCVDDPLKSTDSDSEAVRNKVNSDFDNAVSNRLNDPKTGVRILIMQRLHEMDLVGHILSKKDLHYETLVLPAEYEGVRFESSIGFVDPRAFTGELLWKERFGDREIAELKATLSERGVAGQLQQRPAPAGGFVYKPEWFSYTRDNDSVIGTFISWDTAESINPDAAFSCGIVGELRADYSLFIREVIRKRLLFPQLQTEIELTGLKYANSLSNIIVEYKSSGVQAVQTLKQSSPQWLADKITPFNPKGDKEARAFQAAVWAERGCISLPYPSSNFLWLKDFEDEIFKFPSSAYRDQVDALSQLILYLRNYLALCWQARTSNQRQETSLEGVL